jgi:hypothetical protein
MWYIIIGGIGLAIGLGLMVWALRERSARHVAEQRAIESDMFRRTAETIANANKERCEELEKQMHQTNQQLGSMRGRLNEARSLLEKSKDPKLIKTWLDAELEKIKL